MYHLFIGELIESNSFPHTNSHAPKFYLGFTPFYMPMVLFYFYLPSGLQCPSLCVALLVTEI